jgi:hypothetical protein
MLPLIAGMAAGGALGSILDRQNKKGMTQDAGNPFAQQQEASQKALGDYLKRGHTTGSQEFLDDPLLGKSYQQGQTSLADIMGDVKNVRGEERNLATRGFSMQPEDYEAYGQAAGNIARESAAGDASLAQSLASRGLGTSGMAGRAFAGRQGNKAEQMRQSQMQLAQQRMNTNMQRLGQTRQFMSQLLGQQEGSLGRQQQFGLQGSNAKNQFAQSKADMGQQTLQNLANQSNQNLAQQRAVAPGSFGSALLGGLASGGMSGAGMAASSGMMGGGGGGGGMQAAQSLAQSENSNPYSDVNVKKNQKGY